MVIGSCLLYTIRCCFCHLNIRWETYVCGVNVMQCHVPPVGFFLDGKFVTFDFLVLVFSPSPDSALPLRVSPRDAVKTGPLQTLHLKFLPTDSNHFFIGTNMVRIFFMSMVLFVFQTITHPKCLKNANANIISVLGCSQSWNQSRFEGSSEVLQLSGGWSPTC